MEYFHDMILDTQKNIQKRLNMNKNAFSCECLCYSIFVRVFQVCNFFYLTQIVTNVM